MFTTLEFSEYFRLRGSNGADIHEFHQFGASVGSQ